MLDSAPGRPGGRARRRWRAQVAGSVTVVALAAGVPWLVPQVATSLASVADAIVPAGDAPVVPAAVRVPAVPVAPVPVVEPDVAGAVPRELVIPRLAVRAPVAPVSGRNGELTPPADPRVAGWWQEGAGAGGAGAVVIVGHTVSTGGGVFDDLAALAVSDTVRLRTVDGWNTYVVASTRSYSVGELARRALAVFTRSGPGRLVLVTCSAYDGEVYRARTVVVATPLSRAAGSPG